ncbi:MAG: hypothetical protein KGM44_06050 [bacterium]|nr:hypothetical protein [bacterium]
MRPSPDPRAGWTKLLLAAAVLLLASIELGRMLGFRILAKAVEQTPVLPVVRYTPRPQESLAPVRVRDWKSSSVVQVAPDPHFPDPHVTAPPPPPPPTPEPIRTPQRTPPPAMPAPVDTGGAPQGGGGAGLDGPPTPFRDNNMGP